MTYKSLEAEKYHGETVQHTEENLKGKIGKHLAKGLRKIAVPQCVRTIYENPSKDKQSKKYSVSWANDNDFCVPTQDQFVCVFDAVKGLQKKIPINDSFVMEAAITPDCNVLATGGMCNVINIFKYEGAKGSLTKTFKDPNLEAGSHDGYVSGIHFLEGGSKLLTGSGDATVKLWDVQKGELIQTFRGHTADVSGVCIDAAAPHLFGTSSTDKSIRCWDLREKYAVRKFEAKYSTNCCAMFPGGKGILAGCDNASYEFWDIGSNVQVARGKVKKGRAESVAFSKSGHSCYVGFDAPEVGLIVADSYNPEANFKKIEGHTDVVKGMALSPCGDALATASFDNAVKVWSGPDA